jgi:hypothetical protein
VIKKCWITSHTSNTCSLTFESENALLEHEKLSVFEHSFPKNPTAAHPLRHTICLGLFTTDDLLMIKDVIDSALIGRG